MTRIIDPVCDHSWVLYAPPKRWWRRNVWRLFCGRCGGHAGSWSTKAEAVQRIVDDDWGRRDDPRPGS